MKRMGTLMLALALTATGCVELPIRMETKAPHPAAPPPLLQAEPPPVTPDQVSDGNAPQTLNALRDELDRAADERTPTPEKP